MAHNFRIAGIMAFLAGAAWIAWAVINTITHGGLDAGVPAVSASLARAGRLLIAGFNLFLIPAALVLWNWLSACGPPRPSRSGSRRASKSRIWRFRASGGAVSG